jgi:hypothetical protein
VKKNTALNKSAGNKHESINLLDKYFSVQFSIGSMEPTYLFKLRYDSLNGLFILVGEDSAVMKHLKTGVIVDMKYNTVESSNSTKPLKTLIRDISKIPQRGLMNHFFVGLYIIEEQDERL